jgi:hypothetical protein
VRRHVLGDEGESQSGAFAVAAGGSRAAADETVEYRGAFLGAYSGAFVVDVHVAATDRRPEPDRDGPAAVAYRVVEQVAQDLLHSSPVDQPRQVAIGVEVHEIRGQSAGTTCLPGQLGQRDGRTLQRPVATGQFEQIGDQRLEPRDLRPTKSQQFNLARKS